MNVFLAAVVFSPAPGPINTCLPKQLVKLLPALSPMITFKNAEVIEQPALKPIAIFLSPSFNAAPELQPISMLQQVSESIAAPAPVPATKFP